MKEVKRKIIRRKGKKRKRKLNKFLKSILMHIEKLPYRDPVYEIDENFARFDYHFWEHNVRICIMSTFPFEHKINDPYDLQRAVSSGRKWKLKLFDEDNEVVDIIDVKESKRKIKRRR